MEQAIVEADSFLRQAFQQHPHFSFGDWRIMYEHSRLVRDYALRIAESVPCDTLVLQLGALLHDIGKTVIADEETLRAHHGRMGYDVSKPFLESLRIAPAQREKVLSLFLGGSCVEKRIISDADLLAFLADRRLQEALAQWAEKRGLAGEIERKVSKARSLHFKASMAIAAPLLRKFEKRMQPGSRHREVL